MTTTIPLTFLSPCLVHYTFNNALPGSNWAFFLSQFSQWLNSGINAGLPSATPWQLLHCTGQNSWFFSPFFGKYSSFLILLWHRGIKNGITALFKFTYICILPPTLKKIQHTHFKNKALLEVLSKVNLYFILQQCNKKSIIHILSHFIHLTPNFRFFLRIQVK